MRVAVGKELSTETELSSGVPQGSTLSPILYLLVANGALTLRLSDGTVVFSFADDTTYQTNVDSDAKAEEFKETLNNLKNWCDSCGMKVNPSKSRILVYGNGQFKRDYYIRDDKVPVSHCERNLAVLISDNDSFNAHWSERSKKAYIQVANVKKSTSLRTVPFWRRVWNTYISPVLLYGSQVAYQNDGKIIKMLMKVFRDFWCSMGGPPKGLMNPIERILFLDLKMAKKWTLNQVRVPLDEIFELLIDAKTKSYKNGAFLIPKWERVCSRAENGARVIVSWNSLPSRVRKAILPSFCKEVRKLIVDGKVASPSQEISTLNHQECIKSSTVMNASAEAR